MHGVGRTTRRAIWLALVGLLVLSGTNGAEWNESRERPPLPIHSSTARPSALVVNFNFHHVQAPYTVALWLLAASVVKILFHVNKKFGEAVPDSALLIVVGLALGYVLKALRVDSSLFHLNATVFFLYLLPPIIFDAGYFMPNRQLFDNLGSVLMFAVVGTVWNTVAIGSTIALCNALGWFQHNVELIHSLLFAALISAVDPVAVIAVFEEIHVNEFLFINVFGEAIFNDGIAAVLFQIFQRMVLIGGARLRPADYALFALSFLGVALGGVLLGALFALLSALLTKHTGRVPLVGPVFVFLLPYLCYLTAEMFGLSAILAVCVCGMLMKQYVNANITREAASSVKYFVKMLAQSSEIVVFMFLGLSAISTELEWDWNFLVVVLVACLLHRTIGVVVQCQLLNRFRKKQFTYRDQFVMAYGGLRGAIAFGLLSSIPAQVEPKVRMIFTSTTIVVICFTVFIQGTTIRPLLHFLKIERKQQHEETLVANIYNKYFDYSMTGLEDIVGQKGSNYVRDLFERINAKILKPFLCRHATSEGFDASVIVRTFEKITLKEAMDTIQKHDRRERRQLRPIGERAESSAAENPTSPDNVATLCRVFSQLLDQKLSEFKHSNQRASVLSVNSHEIGDDYLSIMRTQTHFSVSPPAVNAPPSQIGPPVLGQRRRGSHPAMPFKNELGVKSPSRV